MTGLPTIPLRDGKSEQYMFGHLVLPDLLFNHPHLIEGLMGEDGRALLQQVWDAYSRQWGREPEPREIRARYYQHDQGGVAIAVDVPVPEFVPDPHGVLLVLRPVRAYFVIEKTSQVNIQRYLRTAWVRRSSDLPNEAPPNHAGFLCEWTADGGHRNYRYVALNVGLMLNKVSSILQIENAWHEVDRSEIHGLDAMPSPVRVPEERMRPEDAERLSRRVSEIVDSAVDDRSRREAVETLMSVLHDTQLVHGHNTSEITLHRASVLDLMLQAGDIDGARQYCEDWRYFCHEFRGSRAPETAISYTWWARIESEDASRTLEERKEWIRLILEMRQRLPGGVRKDLPGADDPYVSRTFSPRIEGA